MLDVFVINLESSTERKENISRQLSEMKINFHIFPAVDGRVCEHPLFQKYDDKKRQLCRGNSLNRGQLGCYASHYLLWQKCIEVNKPIIVLEDDALLDVDNFLRFYETADNLSSKYECIRLFNNKRKRFSSSMVEAINGISIEKFSKGHMSATGYYLTPEGARKFLQHSPEWFLAVDIYMDRFWVNNVECYGTSPACLTNDPQFISDIGYEIRPKKHLLTKTKREAFNIIEHIGRYIHNAKFHLQNK